MCNVSVDMMYKWQNVTAVTVTAAGHESSSCPKNDPGSKVCEAGRRHPGVVARGRG